MAPKKHPPSEPTARSSKSALLEAAQAAIAEQHARPGRPAASRTGRNAFRGFLAVIFVASTAILVAQPPWLVGPTLPKESAGIKAATATMALVEVMSQLHAYQTANGHLPAALGDIGVADSSIRYRPGAGGDFEVSTRAGDSVVSIRATDSLKTRIGDAIRTLQGRT